MTTTRRPVSLGHRAHDYPFLLKRWRKVARATGLKLGELSPAVEPKVFYLKSKNLPGNGGIYISAGIHGDEPGGTEALITWAEENVKRLSKLPCILFPCLNPWGLINNCRRDQNGRDLNRVFQHDEVPAIKMLKALIKPYRFALSLTLHEDYDAQGVYLYEIERVMPFWGEKLLEAARPVIPRDPRPTIEGRRAKNGLVRRKINMRKFPLVPEALYLHMNQSDRTFTIETPSEFDIRLRVRAQIAVIDECAHLSGVPRP